MENMNASISAHNAVILKLLSELYSGEKDPFRRKKFLMLCHVLAERDSTFVNWIKSQMSNASSSVDDLKSIVSYITFDLEATRRERDKYLKELEGREDDSG
jgi:hypothetical protein